MPSYTSILGSEACGDAILLFGSQALSFSPGAFRELRSSFWNTPDEAWISETVATLPECWDEFISTFPKYGAVGPGTRQLLTDMDTWFRDGDMPSLELPNMILSPLVVIAQLIEYLRFLDIPHSSYPIPPKVCGTLGFCTGLLTAFTASLSQDVSQVRKYGAIAIRLAMLVGVMVDAQEILDTAGPATALATAWISTVGGREELERIVDRVPGSYISVIYDENRATVTTAVSRARDLELELRGAGFKASEIGLHGRFHHRWYSSDVEALVHFCDEHPELCLPDASDMVYPTWTNTGTIMVQGSLHAHAIRTILVDTSEWYREFSLACSSMPDPSRFKIVSFGPERNVPPSTMRTFGPGRVLHMAEIMRETTTRTSKYEHNLPPQPRKEDDVAVIGMSIKVAGADDVEDFWNLLCDGSSQHKEVPNDRMSFENVWREVEPSGRKWYGNFINDHDAFDHRFFKKSAREMSSTDPQQRQMLQVAYQAVEQSGYFVNHNGTAPRELKIGCFIGVCSADYENNAACYAPNAFTAIGNLKSFIAGKISHYFGWTGPSLCIDSACSSSLVAVHQACRAVLSGECSAALAGGANTMTNSLWFQNLAAASFLSPSGQCKPFDENADGYCRGEGFAVVMLKKMSSALADGDVILGTISATAVMQNQNCTPIFVPNAPSLSDLFRRVMHEAQLLPRQITVVEAHGTGTQVGDPAEYSSIRDVLGGNARLEGNHANNSNRKLAVGSVKGLIGHTECTSGAVSLVKTLLMIQHKVIPPQASFNTLNTAIPATSEDNMDIVTKLRPWLPDEDFYASLINNYGASGSNASMVVTESPRSKERLGWGTTTRNEEIEYPFRIFGLDEPALRARCERLRQFLVKKSKGEISIADMAFNLSRQTNPMLEKSVVFGSHSVDGIMRMLDRFLNSNIDTSTTDGTPWQIVSRSTSQPQPPVILCFGGQISTLVGLDRRVYEANDILRKHLHACDDALHMVSHTETIFPAIFQRTPLKDPVKLQMTLFAIQYACAMSWIDCGLYPVALVGHSFGELTALCVSGVLSLRDAVKMVVGRAALIRELWGDEKGAMTSVEGDPESVEALLIKVGGMANIACYNGPRSFTLAGTVAEMDAVSRALSDNPDLSASTRSKRLNVTNAFHSALVEPLIPKLLEIGQQLSFHKPKIPLETATKFPVLGHAFSDRWVADHMRKPVYFHHAVQRLVHKYPSAVFLEAGSNSTITVMASRAVSSSSSKDSPSSTGLRFQGINITSTEGQRSTSKGGSSGQQQLVNATLNLWKYGLHTLVFWPHQREQTYQYKPLLLPPYQFEKSRHWLAMKAPPKVASSTAETSEPFIQQPPLGLFSLVDHNKEARSVRFRINTTTDKYRDLVLGHRIARTAAICPATVMVSIAIEALSSVIPDMSPSNTRWQPQVHDVSNQAAICIDDARVVMLDFSTVDTDSLVWNWSIQSFLPGPGAEPGLATSKEMLHTTGQLVFVSADNAKAEADFMRYERLVGYHEHCADILRGDNRLFSEDECSEDIQVIHGARNIYRAFADVVDYPLIYQGLQRLVGCGNKSAGRVVKKHAGEAWLDPHLADCYSQVGGIWVNCMADCGPGDMSIATGFEKWVVSPALAAVDYVSPETWDVLARHERRPDGKSFLSDIFVFDATNGRLVQVILGVNYHRVSKASMAKTLTRLTPGLSPSFSGGTTKDPMNRLASIGAEDQLDAVLPPPVNPIVDTEKDAGSEEKPVSTAGADTSIKMFKDVKNKIRLILADISGLEPSEIATDSSLADIGIDSLMGMELGREMEGVFKTPLMSDELACVLTFEELVGHVAGVLGLSVALPHVGNSDGIEDVESSSDFAPGSKPTTAPTLETPASWVDPEDCEKVATEHRFPNIDHSNNISVDSDLCLPPSVIFEAFEESKGLTDKFIAEYRCTDYVETVLPKQTQLCVAIAVEAFEELGCSLKSARAGDILPRILHVSQHTRLVDWLYRMLGDEARLLNVSQSGGTYKITRTAVTAPIKRSDAILSDLLKSHPDHEWANRLTFFAGRRLAEILRGELDGIKLIFGTDQGRELVTGLYGDSLLNLLANVQMRDIVTRVVKYATVAPHGFKGPLKIMELGAGTGGTTKGMLPMLAKLGVPVEYTFTDLSGSFVAAARKKFGKEYPWMKFRVHDIEKPPAADLLGSQHIVIASNAIHATHSIEVSVANIRKALRPDGFLMMLEMTEPLFWVDMIFGLFEGWWLFDDGRTHAIAHQTRWEAELHAAGYGRVDWTDGWRPECNIQRVIVAQASIQPGFSLQPARIQFSAPVPIAQTPSSSSLDTVRAQLEDYVIKYTRDFSVPIVNGPQSTDSNREVTGPKENGKKNDDGLCFAVTGATGSLGAHLVAHLASLPNVKMIFCLNRRSHNYADRPQERQVDALETRLLSLSSVEKAKLRALVIDPTKAQLGLDKASYRALTEAVNHIIHNAWPMSGKRPVTGFEPQFMSMRSLIDLARDIALYRGQQRKSFSEPGSGVSKVTFQFISSIAVMGHHSLIKGNSRLAPEDRATIPQILPNGYAYAKWVCERMLDETLHKHPSLFCAMVVRPGQIAGNNITGYWNELEHFSFLVKSSQTLGALPDLQAVGEGDGVSWTPVNAVAAAAVDLVLKSAPSLSTEVRPYPIYHIDNPVRQPWSSVLPVLSQELGSAGKDLIVIPFRDWVHRVKSFPGAVEDNPAVRLIDFLDENFVRMSCGGMLLQTTKVCEHSATMRGVGPVGPEVVRKYIDWWKADGFLH